MLYNCSQYNYFKFTVTTLFKSKINFIFKYFYLQSIVFNFMVKVLLEIFLKLYIRNLYKFKFLNLKNIPVNNRNIFNKKNYLQVLSNRPFFMKFTLFDKKIPRLSWKNSIFYKLRYYVKSLLKIDRIHGSVYWFSFLKLSKLIQIYLQTTTIQSTYKILKKKLYNMSAKVFLKFLYSKYLKLGVQGI